jgi:RNA polymerase sigma factor (sigma-70 family)
MSPCLKDEGQIWAPWISFEVAVAMEVRTLEWSAWERIAVEAEVQVCSSAVYLEDPVNEPAWQDVTSRMYHELNRGLLRFLSGLGLSRDAAEDVAQEAFFRLARQLRSGKKIENLNAWLFRVAYHVCMDFHRVNSQSQSRLTSEYGSIEEPIDLTANPELVYLQKEKERLVRAAMLRLTPQQFRCFQLRAAGRRYREIAADLGVSEQRATHLVKRALMRLELSQQ